VWGLKLKTRKRFAFADWVSDQGQEFIAEKLNVSLRTVHYWLTGHCHPRVDQLREIKKLSGLTYDQIIDRGYLTMRVYAKRGAK
jgi:uncharacterized protein YjcR